jgi:tRNA (adenine58-N1)-methyltransferase non-catalytic subunit
MSKPEESDTVSGCGSTSGVSNVVADGDWAIIKMHDDQDSIVNITRRQQQKIGRNKLSVGPIIGESYGSIFDINGKVISKLDGELLDTHNVQVPSSYKPDGDNRSFSDTNTAQKLTPEAIEQLRAEGMTGNDIISSLIANSDSWNNKTEFSQEKWLRRKQKKYTQRIRVLKCTPVSICDAYYKKNAAKML